jgi:aspartyl-tRNA(Asn)/glutamyl-tRNA(Gln) amidotransferase subunit C
MRRKGFGRQTLDNNVSPALTRSVTLRIPVVSGAFDDKSAPTHRFFLLTPRFPPTMSLTLSDIGRIANLARLELPPAQAERMLTQLNGFFDIVEQMNAVDTTGVEPLAHPTAVIDHVSLRLRPDVTSEPDNREANQQSAPAVERGLFLVPKVIE